MPLDTHAIGCLEGCLRPDIIFLNQRVCLTSFLKSIRLRLVGSAWLRVGSDSDPLRNNDVSDSTPILWYPQKDMQPKTGSTQ